MSASESTAAERFLELLQPIERELETYARRMIWNPADAPDALQNAVLRAVRAFDRYLQGTNFRAWMFTILTRECFALNRKHSRVARFEFQVEPEELEALARAPETPPPPAQTLEGVTDWLDEDLVAALRTLTENERAALLLRAIGQMRYQETAEALAMPLGSVMGHLSRARHKMRAALGRASDSTRTPKRL